MLEQLSYQPSPKGQAAVHDILNKINRDQYKNLIKTKHDDALFREVVFNIVKKTPPQCSYTGWIYGEIDEFVDISIKTYKKKVLLRRKLRGIIKFLVFINKAYQDTIERYYAPNGIFENNASLLWNPILRNNGVHPPLPPLQEK